MSALSTRTTHWLPSGVKTSKRGSGILEEITFPQPYMIYIVRAAVHQEDITSSIDLSGTTICADQPIAVWSGNQAALFPVDLSGSSEDHAFDQLLPINRC